MSLVRHAVAHAPGRVTILGEHTDYNEGRSLAIATPQRTVVAVEPGVAGRLRIDSEALGSTSGAIGATAGPSQLVLAAALAREVGCDGASLRVTGDLPVGAGLSSSAAYAVAVALALGVGGGPLAIARSCQAAERAAGSDVGLLDQLAILTARDGAVVLLDFASLEVATVPLPRRDRAQRRRLRRASCRRHDRLRDATRRVRGRCGAARHALGAATVGDLDRLVDEPLHRRARHVVTECARVDAGREAIAAGDVVGLGRLLDEGHESLRDDFETSTRGVEAARDALRALDGVLGVRLCGAGFGGCLVVAHDPAWSPSLPGRWSARLVGAAGASLSSSR